MKLKYLENIDKCCSDFRECLKCPFKRTPLCKLGYCENKKSFREIIEKIKSIELPPKTIKPIKGTEDVDLKTFKNIVDNLQPITEDKEKELQQKLNDFKSIQKE